ncbi:hypothetical protein CBR_g21855 [Chara braunii]|uniref:Sulfite oxidase n=1 Tax=Chara braunii TaxID=69332 RepID=A0A388JUT0_CHABU|nr:hypothetical protein CBR_g21855 [Chara braunii]|eukprot:GBG61513.1 hypothetical protein CBR_g21855 [Chara braunii]
MEPPLYGPKTYDAEPARDPRLVVNSKEPFNAETPPKELVQAFITPSHLFYKRNHGPIPVLNDAERFHLIVDGLVTKPLSLSLDDLKRLPKNSVAVTLQCAGNRRTALNEVKTVKGVGWGLGAVGTAIWGGVFLHRVLELAGIRPGTKCSAAGGRHVEFESVDRCKEEKGGPYRASITLAKACSEDGDVLLAYEMNGEVLPADHGYPLRVVVPGVIGARSVKWLSRVTVRSDESQGFFQQRDYKMFPPSVDWDNIDWGTRQPIMEYPVQCAVCTPAEGQCIRTGSQVTIKGYAMAGGGRSIERIDVSIDDGNSWTEARRLPPSVPETIGKECGEVSAKWCWVLWELDVRLTTPCVIVAKAVDDSANTMPESMSSIWNLRGVLNNSWHRVRVDGTAEFNARL